MQSTIVNAIHEDDLESILKKLDLLNDVKNGTAICGVCNDKISIDKINALYTKDGKPYLVCDKDVCYHEMLKRDIE